MSPDQIEFFKSRLTAMMDAIAQKNANGGVLAEEAEFLADPSDRASQEADLNFNLLIRERDREVVREIRDAMDRIEEGSYGICEECGEDIAHARLQARPMTLYCVSCQEGLELQSGRLAS